MLTDKQLAEIEDKYKIATSNYLHNDVITARREIFSGNVIPDLLAYIRELQSDINKLFEYGILDKDDYESTCKSCNHRKQEVMVCKKYCPVVALIGEDGNGN